METNTIGTVAVKEVQFSPNPSLKDLEDQLAKQRQLLQECYGTEEERHKIISKIRILRNSIDMMQGYIQHFMLN